MKNQFLVEISISIESWTAEKDRTYDFREEEKFWRQQTEDRNNILIFEIKKEFSRYISKSSGFVIYFIED